MINQKTFGKLLKCKRVEHDITLREMARKLGVSAPFLSDVENNRRAPLTAEHLEKVIQILQLTPYEAQELYDYAGKQKGTIALDLPKYIMGNECVTAALRTARDCGASEADWLQFVEKVKQNHRGSSSLCINFNLPLQKQVYQNCIIEILRELQR